MSLNYNQQIADIKAQIVAVVPNARIIDTFNDAPVINGIMQPHIIVRFGGPVLSGSGGGIVGSRKDPHYMWCHVHCVALTVEAARELKMDVIEALIDFYPFQSGPMTLRGGFSETLVEVGNVPERPDEGGRFEFTINMAE